jgi:hypothetical protein
VTISLSTSSTALPQSTLASGTVDSDANANAVGGVVGGILGLFILCGMLYGYFQWKKRLARNREALLSRTDMENSVSSEVGEPSMPSSESVSSQHAYQIILF